MNKLSDEFFVSEGPINREIRGMQSKFHYNVDIVARLSLYYSIFRATRLIRALRRPPKHIAIRVNTLNTTPEKVMNKINEAGIDASPSKIYDEVLLVKIEGPFEVKLADKKIIAKDKSAEGVYLGANLYMPGVLRMDGNINPGDPVNVVTKYGEIVGYGVSQIASGEKAKKGPVVEIKESVYKMPNLYSLRPFILGDAYISSLASTEALRWLMPERRENVLCVSPSIQDLVYVVQLAGEPNENIRVVSKTELEDAKLREALRKMKLGDWEKKLKFYVIDYKQIKFPKNSLDAIFVTPRNSKIGIRPRLTANLTESEILSLSRDMKSLLDNLIPSLRSGGRLLFNTNSLDPAEGEFVTKYLVETWDLNPIAKRRRWSTPSILDIPYADKAIRVYPDEKEDNGYYGSLLVKE